MVKFRSGLRVGWDQLRYRAPHHLHLVESAGANLLRYTQVRTSRGAKYEVKECSLSPTGAKDLPLHREREAEKNLKTSPENQACSRTVRYVDAQDVKEVIKGSRTVWYVDAQDVKEVIEGSTTPTGAKDLPLQFLPRRRLEVAQKEREEQLQRVVTTLKSTIEDKKHDIEALKKVKINKINWWRILQRS